MIDTVISKIEVKNLFKVFGKQQTKALELRKAGKSKSEVLKQTGSTIGIDNVNFTVRQGEMFVLMGLSGSGKSTILRCLNRLLKPTSGSVVIDGVDITKLEKKELREFRQKHMAMVFQQFALLPHRTVLDNTLFGLEVQGKDRDQNIESAKKALEQVGLKGWENKYPHQLSGGMKQRVGLARALCSNTDILLMDEAFSALDPLIREEMQDLLLDLLADSDKTVIFITHDLNEALKIGDRVAFLKDGALIQVGTPEDIIENPADDYIRKFIQGVDLTRVLSAKDVMKKSSAHVRLTSGPAVALETMKKHGISSVFVVDKKMRYKGLLSVEQAIKLRDQKVQTLENVEFDASPVVDHNTPISELLGLFATSSLPVAVINEENRLLGVIVRSSVLAALDQNEGGSDNV
ncbi:MAG: glycine betaine/L-proline ABC transporter ATP-binding protein [Erysipelotrichaceae bacterium]|nr:glycine betaine/L-proline ABC transporter ATP-binding protein [Erysipelotrichaceae bacterium]MDD3810176.1 glycine betaine/L-proline ABC transporter ATP-binding protein [Erysipelotrichaceae bacterium]